MEQALAPVEPQPLAVAPGGPVAAPGPLARLAQLPPRNRMMLGIGAATLVALLVALALMMGRQEDYKVLYANLSDKDGGAILAQLSQMNVPYRHAEGGSAILIPADKVHDVRLKLASAGLPKGSITGFELMDSARFGQTQFQERLTFQRGLEGELTRSIMSLGSVQGARVHLALPQQNGFFREQQKPSASVLLTLHPGRMLDRAQIAGIVHLVSSSVPELHPKAVSILDQSGALLSGPDGATPQGGLDAQQLAYVHQVERSLQQRVMDILEPVVGRDNLRANVSAEVDFTQSESTSELFKPNQGNEPAAVRSTQSSESNMPGQPVPTGVPGAATNQPPTPATAPVNGQAPPLQSAQNGAGAPPSKRENVTNYEVDKTVRVTRNATGAVKRLTAAVVINHRSSTVKGKTTSQPLSQEELDKLTQLVQESIGFSQERGDSVKVVSAPFQAPEAAPVEALPLWKQPEVLELLRSVGLPLAATLVALIVIFGLVRPALRPPAPEPVVAGGTVDALVADELALTGPDGEPLPALEAPRTNERLEMARQMAKQNPAAVANILREWVNRG